MSRAALRREVHAELWRRGEVAELACRGDPEQLEWIRRAQRTTEPNVWMIGRQRGKSFAACILAFELCLRVPGAIVRYATLTGKSAKAIVLPTVAQLLEDCPSDVRPEVREADGLIRFRNGSTVTFAGTDNEQFDRLRGPRAHLVVIDEAGFVADLERVEGALLPQLTTTDGRALYLSTPPETPAHPFLARYQAARVNGVGVHATIHTNPRLGPGGVRAVIRREAARLGYTEEELQRSTYWRREYLAEVVAEESRAALPSWDETARAECVVDVPRAKFWDGYVSVDLGFGDPTFMIWAWHDVAGNRLVVEDELEVRGADVGQVADAMRAMELSLYGTTRFDGTLLGAREYLEAIPDEYLKACISERAPRQPYLRVGDNDPQVLASLIAEGVAILPTRKDDKAVQVDSLNQGIRQRRLVVHPRCVRLREQMATTLWNRSRTQWERTSKDHGDAIDALVYLWRNVRWHRDCRPPSPRDVFVGTQPVSARQAGIAALGSRLVR